MRTIMEWIAEYGPGLALAGALLAALGVWVTHQEQNRQQVKYEQQIADLNGMLAARTAELAAKSDEVARLAKEGVSTITGGDSFCFLHLGERPSTKGPLASIVHRGRFPLDSVWVDIIDLDRRDALVRDEWTFERLFGPDIRFNPGTVPVGTMATLGRLPVLTGDSRTFEVTFIARNGIWKQLISLRRVNSEWMMSTDVRRQSRDVAEMMKPLYQGTDEGFPTDRPQLGENKP